MVIFYKDELGGCMETIEEGGVQFFDGFAVFNDKKIPIADVVAIEEAQ